MYVKKINKKISLLSLQIEGNVDKTTRTLAEWRTAEAKSKKQSHAAARENEKLQDATLEMRSDSSWYS